MKLYIGGAYQGKTEYVRAHEQLEPAVCTPREALHTPAVNCYHLLVRTLLDAGEDPQTFTKKLITENPDAVILCDEIGMGIVPLDPTERAWREAVGRCLKLLAAASDEVIRIYAGIPVRIR